MAVVIDCQTANSATGEIIKDYLATLKKHSEIFSNVRMNLVLWESKEQITTIVSSMAMLQIGRGIPDFTDATNTVSIPTEAVSTVRNSNDISYILTYLKTFHARSKLILLFTNGHYVLEDSEEKTFCLQPFLGRKLLILCGNTTQTATSYFQS